MPCAGKLRRTDSQGSRARRSAHVKRIERYFGDNALTRFSHYRPAAYFMREQAILIPKLSEKTVERASRLFARINRTLTGAGVPDPWCGPREREGRSVRPPGPSPTQGLDGRTRRDGSLRSAAEVLLRMR